MMSTHSKMKSTKKNENLVDVTQLPQCKLLELLDRQKKIASNSTFLKGLNDKGEKILKFKAEIEDELKKREKNQPVDLLDSMASLSIQEMEWTGKLSRPKETNEKDAQADETDPLKLLATHSGTNFQKKIIVPEEEPEKLITDKDIEEATNSNDGLDDQFVLNICHRIHTVKPPVKFLPNRTLNKSMEKSDKTRDLSAASAPNWKFSSAKEITLEESLKREVENARLIKEIQLKHAAERLRDKTYTIGVLPPEDQLQNYRDVQHESEEDQDESEHDDA